MIHDVIFLLQTDEQTNGRMNGRTSERPSERACVERTNKSTEHLGAIHTLVS